MDSSSSDEYDDIGTYEVTSSPPKEELLPLLECPVCFDLPLPPIRTCNQGHIICAECCPKLSGCPLCQSPIGYGRNFFAEDFISKTTIRCKYRLDGCSMLLAGAGVRDHVKGCTFRPIRCNDCDRKIAFRDYETHLQTEHHVSRWDINENGLSILQEGKKRRPSTIDVSHADAASMIGFVLKSLFAAFALSFVIDQFIGIPDVP